MTLSDILSKDDIMKLIKVKLKQRYAFHIEGLDCSKIDAVLCNLCRNYYEE